MSIDTSSMTKEEIQRALEDAVFNMLSFDDRMTLSQALETLTEGSNEACS